MRLYRRWFDVDGILLEASCEAGQHQKIIDILSDGEGRADYRKLTGIANDTRDPKMLNILLASLGERLKTVDAGYVFSLRDVAIEDFYRKVTGRGCDEKERKALKVGYLTVSKFFKCGLIIMLRAMIIANWAPHSNSRNNIPGSHNAKILVILQLVGDLYYSLVSKVILGIEDKESACCESLSRLFRLYYWISFYWMFQKEVDLDLGDIELANAGLLNPNDQYGQCSQVGLFAGSGIDFDDGVCLEGEGGNEMTI